MAEPTRIEEMSADEIRRQLQLDRHLTDEELVEIKGFLRRMGGIEMARRAMELLSELEKAA